MELLATELENQVEVFRQIRIPSEVINRTF